MLEEMFKQTIFVEDWIKKYGLEKAFIKQCTVVSGELFETQDAFSKNNLYHTKEEIVDVLHSATQLLYMLPNYKNGEVHTIIEQVKNKNSLRNYYVR
jgi:hypothetical protein